MAVRKMSHDECLQLIETTSLARLACSHGGQPYIFLVEIGYDSSRGEPRLYGTRVPEELISTLEANPLVCVEVDEVVDEDWMRVVVLGRYQELPRMAEANRGRTQMRATATREDVYRDQQEASENESALASQVLQTSQSRRRYAASSGHVHHQSHTWIDTFYKIRIDQITGYVSTPEEFGL